MHKKTLISLLLTSVAALSGCATSGPPAVPPQVCLLPPVPPALMQEPTTEQQVRAELFEQPGTPTPPFVPSKAR